jgi:predicted RNA-binding protein YlqC (UPF0109 family)
LERKVTASSCGRGDREVREMLLHTVRSLVNYPDDVEIVLVSEPDNSVFCIETHPEDLDELIGAGGQTARALQAILGASGMKLGRRMTLDIVQKERRPQ